MIQILVEEIILETVNISDTLHFALSMKNVLWASEHKYLKYQCH